MGVGIELFENKSINYRLNCSINRLFLISSSLVLTTDGKHTTLLIAETDFVHFQRLLYTTI